MKLKLSIKGGTDDYSLFRTTLATVSKLRKTCILRFTSSRLVIISTPNSNGTIIDQGQVWCTIPHDVFDTYVVNSIREDNRITMECPCETVFGVLRKFDKCNADELTIKLVRLVTMDNDTGNNAQNNDNTLCGLSFSFYDTRDERTIQHNIKLGVKLLYKAQDDKIIEPTVNYVGILMLHLPNNVGEWGQGFNSWFKRIERYGNLNVLKVHGQRVGEKGSLKVIVDEFDWKLNITWKGPLDAMVSDNMDDELSQVNSTAIGDRSLPPSLPLDYEDDMRIEDSDLIEGGSGVLSNNHTPINADNESLSHGVKNSGHEVIIRARDWKVCAKLYESFEEVILVISHDDSCVFHCSLERGTDREENTKEKGQIIYYISKCKSLA